MEPLTVDQIKLALEKARHRTVLAKARNNQNKVKFHTFCDEYPATREQLTKFLGYVEGLIPSDKFQVFKGLYKLPNKTVEITGSINTKRKRVFAGLDKVYNVQFSDKSAADYWTWYRQERLGLPQVWETKGFEYSKTEFNSAIIVDLPPENTDGTSASGEPYPQPYFYWLKVEHILEYEMADEFSGQFLWIAFEQPNNRLAFFDNKSYRIFEYQNQQIGAEISNVPHELGICPAHWFWNQILDVAEPDIKANCILREKEALDWYQFSYVNKHYADLYIPYTVFSVVESDCEYSNDLHKCDGGFLRDVRTMEYILTPDASGIRRCPVCSQKRFVGPGTVVERPVPDGENADYEPVTKLNADTGAVEYLSQDLKDQRNDIIFACTGSDGTVLTREAVNEDQVAANFEDQTEALMEEKQAWESIQSWTEEVCCRLMFGERFYALNSSLGSSFFVKTESALRNAYQTAKESGASEAELSGLNQQIVETANRNDPVQMQRMQVLSDIEPLRTLSRTEVVQLLSLGLIDQAEAIVKLNFDAYIRRFEREYMNILEFGDEMTYTNKINTIFNTLKQYANGNTTETAIPAGLQAGA